MDFKSLLFPSDRGHAPFIEEIADEFIDPLAYLVAPKLANTRGHLNISAEKNHTVTIKKYSNMEELGPEKLLMARVFLLIISPLFLPFDRLNNWGETVLMAANKRKNPQIIQMIESFKY